MFLLLAGVSHQRTSLELREKLYFAPERLQETLGRLSLYNGLDEKVILSTCNRVEIYSATANQEEGVGAIKSFLCESGHIRAEELTQHLYICHGEDVLRHLFLVASSLDSMVIGEPQILGQVKDAFRMARETGHAGKMLTDVFSRAFRVAKKVREETALGENSVSVSSVAVDLAKKIFGSLEGRTVLLLGAGEMSELAARHLITHGARQVLVANRTLSRAQTLANELGGRAVSFDNITREMAAADIVIASTGAPHIVVTKEIVRAALEVRRDAPIFLIDIAVPRDVDPAVNDIENVFLYDMDDLQTVVAANLQGREKEAEQARKIVEVELENYSRRMQMEGLSQTLVTIRMNVDALRRSELERTLARLGHLEEKDRKAIEAMTQAIVNKVLHGPTSVLRALAEDEMDQESIDLVHRLFGVGGMGDDINPMNRGNDVSPS
ncbi:MAG: glutamyl-tRNA reductase [bacterium]|nr:glutamyl-tRNA reductase [bacterium]